MRDVGEVSCDDGREQNRKRKKGEDGRREERGVGEREYVKTGASRVREKEKLREREKKKTVRNRERK